MGEPSRDLWFLLPSFLGDSNFSGVFLNSFPKSLLLASLPGLLFRGLLLSLIIGTLLGDLLSFILGSLGPGLGVLGPLILERSPRKLGEGDLSDKDLLGISYIIFSDR